MANEKTNSPRDAAVAVLAKAQTLLNKKTSPSMDDVKTEDLKKSAEFTSGLHTVEYHGLDSAKYSTQQAALAVLAKAQDMLSETVSIRSDNMQKSAEADSGMHKVEYYSAQPMEKGSKSGSYTSPKGWKTDPGDRESGHEKGVNTVSKLGAHALSQTGNKDSKLISRPSKAQHKQTLGEMKSMPSPSLPKSEMLCSEHAMGKTEGVVSKAECTKCSGGMQKSEWSDLYEDLAKMEKYEGEDPNKENEIGTRFKKSDEGQGAGNKKAPSNDMKPKIEEKPIERDYKDFETQPGKPSASPDHREEPSHPTPDENPAAHGQGSNPPAGTKPVNGKGIHKLSFFMGHRHHKNAAKKMNPAG